MRTAYEIKDLTEDELIGQPDKWGAAALLLMTKLNLLSESSIMDSTLFDNCARENDFDSNSREIQHVKKHWKSIENKNGIFSFKKVDLNLDLLDYFDLDDYFLDIKILVNRVDENFYLIMVKELVVYFRINF